MSSDRFVVGWDQRDLYAGGSHEVLQNWDYAGQPYNISPNLCQNKRNQIHVAPVNTDKHYKKPSKYILYLYVPLLSSTLNS